MQRPHIYNLNEQFRLDDAVPSKEISSAYTVESPVLIADLPHEQACWIMKGASTLTSQKSAISAAFCNSAEDWKVQITPLKIMESSNSQSLAKDWQCKFNTFELYSEYCGEFDDTLTQWSFLRNGHLSQIRIAKKRILSLFYPNTVHSALYRAGPSVREFQRFEAKKTLS